MGFPMARNLARAGFEVRAWNRSREKAEPLTDDGIIVVGSSAETLEAADVIVTMLSDADAVVESMTEAPAGEPADEALWLQMSTIGEGGTERCGELAGERGLGFIDAPVLGTKQPAQEAKLVVLASGPSELKDRAQPIFDAVGQRTMWVGGPGAGTRLKVAINNWILSIVEGAAETLALAEGLDLDPQLVLDALAGGPLDLPYLQMKGRAIIERDFEPSFRLALAAKDASLIEESADRRDLDLPLSRTIRDRLAQGAEEHPDKDMSATYLTSAPS
jgi:3-hydroxyisobutyrate dehydrogenase